MPVTKEMGSLEFYPGSHLNGKRGHVSTAWGQAGRAAAATAKPPNRYRSVWSQGFHFDESKLDSEFGPRVNPGASGMQPGDVTIHNGWTIHRSVSGYTTKFLVY